MRLLFRWHVWLGWLIGVPLLLWTASGLFMVSWPIEEVRGGHLRAEPRPVALRGLVLPQAGPVAKLTLLDEAGRPVWITAAADGALRRFDARSGLALLSVDEAEARAIATANWTPRKTGSA
jgi:streptogramin lyase